jgi:hypothetical protein
MSATFVRHYYFRPTLKVGLPSGKNHGEMDSFYPEHRDNLQNHRGIFAIGETAHLRQRSTQMVRLRAHWLSHLSGRQP